MSETHANNLFIKYKKHIIKTLGKKALDEIQIKNICKELIGTKFKGVYPVDKLPSTSGFFVINTDSSKKINTPDAHWMAVVQTPTTLYIYDSYGRTTKRMLPLIYDSTKKKIVESKHDPEQFGHSALCGQLSISFLCVAHDLGIRQSLKI